MIDQALGVVAERLKGHLAARYKMPDLVKLSPLTDVEGRPAKDAREGLVMFLTNIARDTTPRPPPIRSGAQIQHAQPLHLDVYFMVASAYEPELYQEGLKLLSAVLMYFQTYPVMTRVNAPEMPAGLEQLSIEISNLRVEEMGQMWGNLGGRYVPSVMFKMRSVMIDSGAMTDVVPLITMPGAQVQPGPSKVAT